MLTLIVKEGENPRTLQLSQNVITLGRSKENVIVLKNIKASRQHAKIEHVDESYQITDSGSGNGTKVNGEKINFTTLGPGDEIKIGDALITVKSIEEAAASDEPVDPESDTPVDDELKIEIQDDDKIDIMDDERETEISVKAAPPPPPKAAPTPAPKAAAPAPKAAPAAPAKKIELPKRPSFAERFKKKKE